MFGMFGPESGPDPFVKFVSMTVLVICIITFVLFRIMHMANW